MPKRLARIARVFKDSSLRLTANGVSAYEQHLALEWSCPKNIDRLSQLEAEQTALTLASHIAVLRKNQIQQ